MNQRISTILYVLMVGLGVFQYLNTGDLMQCFANLGIALVFDPFDKDVPWKNRKSWQKGVLLVHVGVVIILFFVANMPDIAKGISDGWNGR
ncbi:MAG: hypothetical protein ACK5Q2_06640 [Bacteroidota bacterium]